MSTAIPEVQRLPTPYDVPQRLISDFLGLMGQSPELASLVARDVAKIAGFDCSAEAAGGRNFAAVARALVRSGNRGLRKEELAEAAGLSVQSVLTLIYRSRPEAFQRSPVPEGGRALLFRLTPPAFQAASERSGGAVAR